MDLRWPLLAISILRGLAFSETGIVNRSTPASYSAFTRSVSRLSPRISCRLNTPLGLVPLFNLVNRGGHDLTWLP